MKNTITFKLAGSLLMLALLAGGCDSDTLAIDEQTLELSIPKTSNTVVQTASVPSSITSSFSLPDGPWMRAQASSEWGNISGWNDTRGLLTGGRGRVGLLANKILGDGGLISEVDIADGAAYEVSYTIRFDGGFDWSMGGKAGFGFLIGDGNTGCDQANDGNGGSARLMWSSDRSGNGFFKPYIYYKDMPSTCGNDFGARYPASGSLTKGAIYKVYMYIKSNTGSNTDGHLRIKINETTLVDRPMRWTTNDSKRLINKLTFHTFRGGSDVSAWSSKSVGYVYYDDLKVERLDNKLPDLSDALDLSPVTDAIDQILPAPSSITSSFSLPDGPWLRSQVSSEWGNISGWNDARALLTGGRGRITLPADKVLADGGLISEVNMANGSAYEVSYTIRFDGGFDWGKGGKAGFGFLLGDGNTGCDQANDGNGGSARIMWSSDKSGNGFFKPYIYYKDMPSSCGNDFGVRYPATGSLTKGAIYKVYMYVKSNTGSNNDGHIRIKINETTLLDQPIRWTTNDSKRLINKLSFHTFRGGDDQSWASPSVGYVYYDDLKVLKLQ